MSLSGNPPEGSYLEPSADFQPICGRKNTKDDPKVVFFLCFSLSPCNDFQLVAILCPNLIHYQLGGEDGIRTRGTGYPVRQFSKLVVSATHPPLRFCGCVPLTFSKRGAKVSQKCGNTK